MRYEVMRQIERDLVFLEQRLRKLVIEEFPVGCRVRIKAGQGHTFGKVVAHGMAPGKPCRNVYCENTYSGNAGSRPRWHDYRNLERILSAP